MYIYIYIYNNLNLRKYKKILNNFKIDANILKNTFLPDLCNHVSR